MLSKSHMKNAIFESHRATEYGSRVGRCQSPNYIGAIFRSVTIEFGKLLKSARLNSFNPDTGKNYTADDLAVELGLVRQTITAWEAGKLLKAPTVEHVNKLAYLLPVSVFELCQAVGFNLEDPKIKPSEWQLLMAFRRCTPDQQELVRAGVLRGSRLHRERETKRAG